MDSLVSDLMYIARVLIILAGGGFGIVKMVKGKSDESPRDFNEGLVALAAAGVIFAATFAIEKIFTV